MAGKKALISVSDKTSIIEFSKELITLGFEIISTGGTYKTLVDAGLSPINISEVTGFKECLDGRLKTLHPNIHGGILAIRDNDEHIQQLNELNINLIDLVVVNLYPFQKTVSNISSTLENAIENIDIGGPTMLRSAAKNFRYVTVIVDPSDYDKVIDELKDNDSVCEATRFYLAEKVFAHTSYYDAIIADYFKLQLKESEINFSEKITLSFEKVTDLSYGENPHQKAAFYKEIFAPSSSLVNIEQLNGKPLSFNNINDTNGALELLREFDAPTVVACKHANPCGVSSRENIFKAWQKAYQSDPVSIYGGIVVANRLIDKETALEMSKVFLEVILAPDYSDEALEIFSHKKNLRVIRLNLSKLEFSSSLLDVKKVSGGLLIQEADRNFITKEIWNVVTEKAPTEKERLDLLFAFKIVKHVKSNGITIAKDNQSMGIGPGQVNRIWSVRQAIEHSKEFFGDDALLGSVLASDAFFPFADCVSAAALAGIKAIIQPGGSIRDKESIDACNNHGIAMVFTKTRHFRH